MLGPVRLVVRTSGFHLGNRSSILLPATINPHLLGVNYYIIKDFIESFFIEIEKYHSPLILLGMN